MALDRSKTLDIHMEFQGVEWQGRRIKRALKEDFN